MVNNSDSDKGVKTTGVHPITVSLLAIKNRLIGEYASPELIRVSIKEELQNHVLFAIYNDSEAKELIFYGGTCLRKIHDLNRLSEDLDFETDKELDLDEVAVKISDYFAGIKYSADYSVQRGGDISRITFKFPVLYDLGLSKIPTEKLHVKVEVNKIPKVKFPTERTPLMHNQLSMLILHYNIETLMAGKILACLNRVFKKGNTGIVIKGRDYYDLIWYMQQNIKPNEEKLIDYDPSYTVSKVFNLLDEKILKITFEDLYADLAFLFENQQFIKDWCRDFHDFYKKYRVNYM